MMYVSLEILVEQFYKLKHTVHTFNLELSDLDLRIEDIKTPHKSMGNGLARIRSSNWIRFKVRNKYEPIREID